MGRKKDKNPKLINNKKMGKIKKKFNKVQKLILAIILIKWKKKKQKVKKKEKKKENNKMDNQYNKILMSLVLIKMREVMACNKIQMHNKHRTLWKKKKKFKVKIKKKRKFLIQKTNSNNRLIKI